MSGSPLVSVVIPFCNAGGFLEECLASVVGQTYPHWELLLVDDASADVSTEIARTCGARDPSRVRLLEHPRRQNLGVSASRNLGLRLARGTYVAFLDADDVWMPRKLEEQVRHLGQHPRAVMVYGRMRYWYSWSGRPEDATRDYEPDPGVAPGEVLPPPLLLVRLLEGVARAPLPSDPLLRLATVRQVGGFEEQRAFSVYEDRVFFVKIALAGGVYCADRCWVKYRQHEGSSCAIVRRTGRREEARQAYLTWLEAYLRRQGYRGTPLWRLARRQTLPYRHPLVARALGRFRRARSDLTGLLRRWGESSAPERSSLS